MQGEGGGGGSDHILTNHPKCFQQSSTYETGLSDFHELTYTFLKMYYAKKKARFVKYRIYKNFSNYKFRRDMSKVLSLSNLQKDEFDSFKCLASALLDPQAYLTI